jgi:hypothetical protein
VSVLRRGLETRQVFEAEALQAGGGDIKEEVVADPDEQVSL